jgi:hypothetical protein
MPRRTLADKGYLSRRIRVVLTAAEWQALASAAADRDWPDSWVVECATRAWVREARDPNDEPYLVKRPEFPTYVDSQGNEHAEY